MMEKFIQAFDGKKTYLVAVSAAVTNLLMAMGIIPESWFETLNAIHVAMAGGTFRSAMKKTEVSK